MCGFIDDILDFVGDIGSGLDDAFHSVGSFLDDSVHNLAGGFDDLVHGDLQGVWDRTSADFSNFDDLGHDMFGTGGWFAPAVNMVTMGNPFVGPGNLAADAVVGMDGGKKSRGSLDPFQSAYSLGNSIYDMGSSASDMSYEPNVEFGSDASNYYDTLQQGSPLTIGDVANNGSSFMDAPDLSGFSGLYDQVSGFLNSGTGQAVRTGAGMFNPSVGAGLNAVANPTLGNIFNAAGTMYNADQARRANSKYIDAVNAQAQGLNDIFSPNSAYAQQLEQELARRDAAAGRRSQYGPRSVELQAKLAQAQAGARTSAMQTMASPTMLNAQTGGLPSRNAAVGSIINAGKGLYDIYNQPTATPPIAPQYNLPNVQFGNTGQSPLSFADWYQ